MSEQGLPQIDGYSIEGLLGSGAMGAVYKALQESMGRHVALKVIHQRFAEDGEYVERFLREARSMGKLNHPNVVQGYDSGKSHGNYFLAMEFVEGESLNLVLERDETLDEERARRVAEDVALALKHAHERGLIHRDIKPSNIIGMADGRNKVTDFGLARAAEDPSLTMAGQTVGTPLYIAPELIDGSQPVTIKCDIYSLGATLYHLVAGEPPFVGKTATSVMTKHMRENAQPLDERCPNLTKGFSRLVARLMTKNFDLRPQTPDDVLAMLASLEPVQPPIDLSATVVDTSRDFAFRETMDAETMENHLANLPGEFAQDGPDTEPQQRPPVPVRDAHASDAVTRDMPTGEVAFRETMPNLPLSHPALQTATGAGNDQTVAPTGAGAETMAPTGAGAETMAPTGAGAETMVPTGAGAETMVGGVGFHESDDVELEVEAAPSERVTFAPDLHGQPTEPSMPAVRMASQPETVPPTMATMPPLHSGSGPSAIHGGTDEASDPVNELSLAPTPVSIPASTPAVAPASALTPAVAPASALTPVVAPAFPAPPPAPLKQPALTQPTRSGAHSQMHSSPPSSSSPIHAQKRESGPLPAQKSGPSFVAKPVVKPARPAKKRGLQRKAQLTLAKTFGLVIPCLLVAFGGAFVTLLVIDKWPVVIKKEILHALVLGAGVLAPLAAVRLLENPPLLSVVGLLGVAATALFPSFGLFEMTREATLIVVALMGGWAALAASAIGEGGRGREFPQSSLGALFLFGERTIVAVPLYAIFLGAGLDLMEAPLFTEVSSQMTLLQALALLGGVAALPAFEIAKTVAARPPMEEDDDPVSAREGLKRPQLSKDEKSTTRHVLGLVFTVVCCLLLEVALGNKNLGSLRYVWAAMYLVPIILAAHFANPLLTRPLATFFTALGPVVATVFLLRWHKIFKSFRLSQLQGQVILGLAMVCMAIMANGLVEKVLSRKRHGSLGEMTYLGPRIILHLVFQALLFGAYFSITPFGALLKAPIVFLLAMGSALTGGLSLEWTKWHLHRKNSSKSLIGLGLDWIVKPPA